MYVDIAFSLNRTLLTPLLVSMNSIIQNASTPSSDGFDSLAPLRFNIMVPPGDRAFFTQHIQAAFDGNSNTATFRIREFTPSAYLQDYLDNKFKEYRGDRRHSRYMQYARLYLKDVYPDIGRVIYLDGDTLILGDVRSLFAEGSQLTSERYLAAAPHFFPAFLYFGNPIREWSEMMKLKSPFNSGVLLTDLAFWTMQTYDLLHHYLDLDKRRNYRFYVLGDESVLNMMFRDTYLPLSKRWNCCGYGQPGWMIPLMKKDIKDIDIIHWSGGYHKPWEQGRGNDSSQNGVVYSDIWHRYLPTSI